MWFMAKEVCGFSSSGKDLYQARLEVDPQGKPYIDAELDIALERLLYVRRRPKGQSFAQYLTHLKKLRDDVCDILGNEEIKCSRYGHVEHRKHKIPEYIWRYFMLKRATLPRKRSE